MPSGEPGRTSGWALALQAVAAVVIAFVLIAGPQVETLWGQVRATLVALSQPRPTATPGAQPRPVDPAPPKPAKAQPVQIQPVRTQPARTQPAPKPSLARPAASSTPVATPRRPYAPVLTEPKTDPRPTFAALMQDGYELYRAGWYGPAMGRFKAASVIMPGSVTAFLWTGRAGLKAGRTAEARRALERVIALAPGSEAAREAKALLGTYE
jgi:hypothetical protein